MRVTVAEQEALAREKQAQGQANADVDDSVKGITGGDALKIQQWLLKSISEL